MTSIDVQQSLNLPPADQLGFVVNNLEQSIAKYDPLFGPFKTMDSTVEAAEYRGRHADVELKLAFGSSGPLEIELIEWVGGDSPHAEFIRAGKEGMHHIRFRVEDCDLEIRRIAALGFSCIWYKSMGGGIKFAYLERADDPLLIEFLQMPAGHY
jgi:hypothetical protein